MDPNQALLNLCIRRGLISQTLLDQLLSDCQGDFAKAVDLLKERALVLAEELEALRPLCQGAASEPPRAFGRYLVLGEVGRGGMAIVYKAHDPRLDRVVALKVLQLSEPMMETGERFEKEARTMARLSHPNIVQIYDVGEIDGRKYFTMQYLQGTTFADWLRRTPGPSRYIRGIEVLRDAALAVEYAHAQGVIHRDFKPQNILLEANRPYVMDFGLAREVAPPKRLTLSGTVVGTPQYMAPEQARGGRVDPRTDVYALGAVLYEALTGFPPFSGPTVYAIINKLLVEDPMPPRERNKRAPLDLETVCLRAMEKDPEKRYQSAGEFAEELNRYLRGDPVAARPVGALTRVARRVRRQRVFLGWALGVALAGSVAAVVILNLNQHTTTEIQNAQHLRDEADSGRRQAVEQKQKRDRALALALEARRVLDRFEFAILNRGLEMPEVESFKRQILKSVDDALDVDERFAMPYALRGRLFELLGDDKKARSDYIAAVNAEPESIYGYYYLAKLHIAKYEEARMLPGVRVTASGLEFTETPSGPDAGLDLETARRYFDRVCELHARFSQAEFEHDLSDAISQVYEGRYEWAKQKLEKLVDRAGDSPDVFYYLGLCRFYLKDFAGAVEEFTRAQARAGRLAHVYLRRAMAHYCLGALLRMKQSDPTSRLEAAMSDATVALRIHEQGAIAAAPPSRRAREQRDLYQVRALAALDLGLTHAGAGVDPSSEYAFAANDLQSAVGLAPISGDLHNMLGVTYARLGSWQAEHQIDATQARELAVSSFTRALACEPESLEALNNRAEVFLKMGRPHEAIDDTTRVLEKREFPETLFVRGCAWFELKDPRAALADWERCRQIEVEFQGRTLDDLMERARAALKGH